MEVVFPTSLTAMLRSSRRSDEQEGCPSAGSCGLLALKHSYYCLCFLQYCNASVPVNLCKRGKVVITGHSLFNPSFRFFTAQIITQTPVLENWTETWDMLSPSSSGFADEENYFDNPCGRLMRVTVLSWTSCMWYCSWCSGFPHLKHSWIFPSKP